MKISANRYIIMRNKRTEVLCETKYRRNKWRNIHDIGFHHVRRFVSVRRARLVCDNYMDAEIVPVEETYIACDVQ